MKDNNRLDRQHNISLPNKTLIILTKMWGTHRILWGTFEHSIWAFILALKMLKIGVFFGNDEHKNVAQ